MTHTKLLFKIISRSLFQRETTMTYSRTLKAILLLCDSVLDETETYWDLNDSGMASLTDLLSGAYWYCAEYHTGQFSLEYQVLSSVGRIYTPGISETGPEKDSSETIVYNSLIDKRVSSLLPGPVK